MSYQSLNRPHAAPELTMSSGTQQPNVMGHNNSQKPYMNQTTGSPPSTSSNGSGQGHSPSGPQHTSSWASIGRKGSRPFSIPSPAWEHKLNEKHIGGMPVNSETTRYFNRSRQTRRVLIDCLFMWLGTAVICGGLAGVLGGFSSLREGISQQQKYAYNALVTILSIILGLAFAAQFKQYCEMMRWRFLASCYRSLDEFEEVLGCDSWRSTIRLIFKGRKGSWLPTKSQILAFWWLVLFIAFNVFVALIGLTYSIDVSDEFVSISRNNVSVVELSYIATQPQAKPDEYNVYNQMAAAHLWGSVGQNFGYVANETIDDVWAPTAPTVWTNAEADSWWYRFIDLSPDTGHQSNIVTPRTVNSSATCEELTITFGGYAGFNTDAGDPRQFALAWNDTQGNSFETIVNDVQSGASTWMGNWTTNATNWPISPPCGDRCTQLLVLQTANNLTVEEAAQYGVQSVPEPRLFACNNTVSQVTYNDYENFEDPTRIEIPDFQARILAGAIGWSGVPTIGDPSVANAVALQYTRIPGENSFNPAGNATAFYISELVMKFTVDALAAMDQQGGPRFNMTGDYSPGPAQVVNVKWPYAGAILAGIPIVQLIMLFVVVWFSSKAIILEPSFLTAAHLLYPVMQELGPHGMLLSVDEMTEKMGPDYKIAYAVRPNESDPGHHDTTFVRDLSVVRETEGFGYIRGKMPEGRYD